MEGTLESKEGQIIVAGTFKVMSLLNLLLLKALQYSLEILMLNM